MSRSPQAAADPVAGSAADHVAGSAPDHGADPADEVPAGTHTRPGRRWWVGGVAIAVLVVVVLAPLASSDPDGLERVAEDQGFIGQAQNLFSGLLGDYAIPGVDSAWLSTVLSGLLGVAIVLGVVFLLGRLVARRRA